MTYTVLGLSHDDKHVELHETASEHQAVRWIDLYTNRGNWGGYYGLAVIDPDGTWVRTFDAPELEVDYVNPHIVTADDAVCEGQPLAYVHRASEESVGKVLSAHVGTGDGRSEWVWLRLPNGDLILGVYPQGETYMSLEDDAAFPDN